MAALGNPTCICNPTLIAIDVLDAEELLGLARTKKAEREITVKNARVLFLGHFLKIGIFSKVLVPRRRNSVSV